MTLGERIKARRERLHLDQKSLAKVLGVAQSSVCDWETGRNHPTRARIPALASALKLTTARVLTWWLGA